MPKIFVDTNYFLRLLLQDVSSQHIKAKELFLSGAQNEVKLFTSIIVIFELYWVLSSFYKKRKKQIASILRDILKMNFVDIAEREVLLEAIFLFENTNFDMEDCYNIVYAKNGKTSKLATFDKKLGKQFSK